MFYNLDGPVIIRENLIKLPMGTKKAVMGTLGEGFKHKHILFNILTIRSTILGYLYGHRVSICKTSLLVKLRR